MAKNLSYVHFANTPSRGLKSSQAQKGAGTETPPGMRISVNIIGNLN